jgi:hypothetical protein
MGTEEEQHRDVYAQFGAVACRVASFETILANILLLHARLTGKAPTADDLERMEEEFQQKRYTLGAFIKEVRAAVPVPEQTERLMKEALDRRNYLMHSFFRDKALEFVTEAGRARMMEELRLTEATVLTADKLTTKLALELARHLGITLETIAAEVEQMRRGSENRNAVKAHD